VTELISIRDALEKDITELCQRHWVFKKDRLEITISDGFIGAVAYIVSPETHAVLPDIPERQPVLVTTLDLDEKKYLPWEDPDGK